MNILGIEAFLAILRSESLSKAAEYLNLSQSSVSHRLSSLEQDLGTILIERSKGTKNLVLTKAGEDFIPIAERWMYLLEDTQKFQKGKSSHLISFAANDSLNNYVFPPLFEKLTTHSPAINIRIHTQNSIEIYDSIEKHKIDIGFVSKNINSKNTIVQPLFSEKMLLIQLKSDMNSGIRIVHPNELDPSYEIFFDWGDNYMRWHDTWWGLIKYPRIWADTVSLIHKLMVDPKYWAIVPTSIAYQFQKNGNYSVCGIVDPPPDRTCYKITPKFPNSDNKTSIKIIDTYLKDIVLPFFEVY